VQGEGPQQHREKDMTDIPAIPVHVGTDTPEQWESIEASQRELGDRAHPRLRDMRRPSIASLAIEWAGQGLEPRWIGDDAADCVAALEPSVFSGRGAHEYERFRLGASDRGEMAMVVSTLGSAGEDSDHNAFRNRSASLTLPNGFGQIQATRLGRGAAVRPHADCGEADRDLALRLLNQQPALTWSVLELSGSMMHGSFDAHFRPPGGTLEPIITTALGEVAAGVWTDPDGAERRYILPSGVAWKGVLDWLVQRGIPEYAPTAARRYRSISVRQAELLTSREREFMRRLDGLETTYRQDRELLEEELAEAQRVADPVRDGLLYGTGKELEEAVSTVLRAAGLTTIDLDQSLRGTRNADLLCSYSGGARLVEVKSATGRAGERLYDDLVRHLREWTALPEAVPIDGGVLIVNHELRSAPTDRSAHPYTRADFLAAQTQPIVTTVELFDAWREERWQDIRAMLHLADSQPADATHLADSAGEEPASVQPRSEDGSNARVERRVRRWSRRERG
jgi:hypothetical protein